MEKRTESENAFAICTTFCSSIAFIAMFPNLAFLGIYGFTLANRSMCSDWRRLKQPGCESAGLSVSSDT